MAPPVQEIIGFWGKPTSTLDWCENNYEVRNFIVFSQMKKGVC